MTLVHVEEAMGTTFSFRLEPGSLEADSAAAAVAAACRLLHESDDVFSIWRDDSAISRLRRGELAVGDAPPEVAEVLDLCHRAAALTDDSFDAWASPDGVDPTGIVKGWAVQRAAELLRDAGFAHVQVNGGGDIQLFGGAQRIGVRSPGRVDLLACIVEVEGAIATSGLYERGGHLLDPRTGQPASGPLSATVVGPELWLADALATGLFVEGLPGLARVAALEGYSALLIEGDGSMRPSPGFPLVDPA
ncbi:MAG: FAD:protein FMN transferase [Gaiellales bacterium]